MGDPNDLDNDIEIEIEGDESDIDIDVVDDTPQEDRGKTPLPPEIVDEIENDDLSDYSAKVADRIKKEKKRQHDLRREKEAKERELDAMSNYARQLHADNEKLRRTLTHGERTLLATSERAAAEAMHNAKQRLKNAYESGDVDQIAEAQMLVTQVTNEVQQVVNHKNYLQREQDNVSSQPTVPASAPVDYKAQEWAKDNKWFGTDQQMTAYANLVHTNLVNSREAGFIGSDAYWDTVNYAIRERFPDKFGENKAKQTTKKPGLVAPASRSTAPRKVRLTTSEIATAKRLGVTPEAYAKSKLEMER
jgi:hypothetical protein